MYDCHLTRISGRPGESLQVYLCKKLISKLNRYELAKGARVLEVGVGSGRLAKELALQEFDYVGIEPTNAMRKYASKQLERFKNCTIVNQRLPFLDSKHYGKFDVVFMIHVIEHAKNGDEAFSWLENIKEILNERGLLVIVAPSIKQHSWIFWDVDYTHSFPTTLNRISEILTALDFKVEEAYLINGWLNLRFFGQLLSLLARCLPVESIDNFCRKMFKTEKLFTGFLVGFVLSNCLIIARRNTS